MMYEEARLDKVLMDRARCSKLKSCAPEPSKLTHLTP